MKKIWKILIICAVALSVLAVTCPGRQRHVDAEVKFMKNMMHKQTKMLEKSYKEQHNNQEMPDKGKQLMAQLEKSLISQMKPAIENVLVVKNYVLFSVGQMKNETDGVTTMSVGILGMVFPNKKELKTDINYNTNGGNTSVIHEVDSSMIDPFYVTNNPHTFRIADTQAVTGFGMGQYSVSWYVDTEEWDFDPETNHIFAKIEFKKGNTVLGTFIDDEGWSYFGVENSKAIMFKQFTIDSENTALVFRGGAYAAGVPNLTIFVICGDQVKLVYNKEYFIGKVYNNRIIIQKEYQGPELGTITISDGHITIVSREYPTGKIIY